MWIFDGEEWTDDNAPRSGAPKRERQAPSSKEHLPELQILEIINVPKTNRVPPYPVPLP
jgi:hypothetical protein